MGYGTNQWEKGIFGCFSNYQNCLYGWCCECCAEGKVYEKLGYESCFPFCCLSPCVCATWVLRDMVRKRSGIEGSCCGDCMCAFCCRCCVVIQLLNQTEVFPAQQAM